MRNYFIGFFILIFIQEGYSQNIRLNSTRKYDQEIRDIFFDSTTSTIVKTFMHGVYLNDCKVQLKSEEYVDDCKFGFIITSDYSQAQIYLTLIRLYRIRENQLELIKEFSVNSREAEAIILNKSRILIQHIDEGQLCSLNLYDSNLEWISNIPFMADGCIEGQTFLVLDDKFFYFSGEITYQKVRVFKIDSYTGDSITSIDIKNVSFLDFYKCDSIIICSSVEMSCALNFELNLLWSLDMNCYEFSPSMEKEIIIACTSDSLIFINSNGKPVKSLNLIDLGIIKKNQNYHLLNLKCNYIPIVITEEFFHATRKNRITLLDPQGKIKNSSPSYSTTSSDVVILNDKASWKLITSNSIIEISK